MSIPPCGNEQCKMIRQTYPKCAVIRPPVGYLDVSFCTIIISVPISARTEMLENPWRSDRHQSSIIVMFAPVKARSPKIQKCSLIKISPNRGDTGTPTKTALFYTQHNLGNAVLCGLGLAVLGWAGLGCAVL